MNAAVLIGKYGKDVTLRRQDAAGQYVDRIYQQGAYVDSTVRMSIQPLDGDELLQFPEAQRTREFTRGYTATELFTAKLSPSKKADLIIDSVRGITYEVQKVEPWESSNNNIQPFWKVIMAKVNPRENE